MFFRRKRSGSRVYLQVVENRWEGGRSKQRVIATLGRLDRLEQSGQLEGLLRSGAKFCESVVLLAAHRRGETTAVRTRPIGPARVFERLWRQTGCRQVIGRLLEERKFEFPVERAVFLTVLHRLFTSGSDRAAEKWKETIEIGGVDGLELHHLYRAMAWLGEALGDQQQFAATPFAPRCTKDLIEEGLFAFRRDLFTNLDLVFFDTTSIYFEGEGGETLGQYGHSKDHRPDLKQMVVAAVLDGEGRPVCCELWPGNTADVTTLVPIVDRLRNRFSIGQVCIVADRGMINRGYRKYLKRGTAKFEIDEAKIKQEGRYDGKWVLRTNTDLPAADVALKYKQLWMVEHMFRSTKSLLETRPIWHKCDETIRGHVFCSFLALVLRKELQDRLEAAGHQLEWADITRDLMNLEYAQLEQDGKRFLLRSEAQGTCGAVFAAAGVALPPTVQQIQAP
jgi:hypothetical protein